MKDDFKTVKKYIENLCETYKIPAPKISKALPNDPCDFTGYNEIRIKTVPRIDKWYHAKHVFGHYLADMHDIYPDIVADIISKMIG